jgi:nanoRNase/pAp phosphatase (c-di-AMP/oligoRNAs hydrolase)
VSGVNSHDVFVMQTADITEVEEFESPHRLDEELRVILWRTSSLSRAGYDEHVALELALTASVDHHVAADLLARGCPQTTALRILL